MHQHRQTLFDEAPIGIWVSDPAIDGAILEVNDALCELFQMSREQILASRKQDLMETLEPEAEARTPMPQPGGAVAAERKLTLANGEVRWLKIHARILDEDGDLRAVAYFMDVTATKVAEQELRRVSEFQEAVLTTSPDVVSIFDLGTGQTVWASKSLGDLMGYNLGEVRQLRAGGMSRFLHPDELETFGKSMQEVSTAADGEVVQSSTRVLHADGTWRNVARRSTPFERDPAGRVTKVLNVSWDITDHTAATQELEHIRACQDAMIAQQPH